MFIEKEEQIYETINAETAVSTAEEKNENNAYDFTLSSIRTIDNNHGRFRTKVKINGKQLTMGVDSKAAQKPKQYYNS